MRVIAKTEGKKYHGRSVSFSEEKALLTASVEAIERLTQAKHSGLGMSGFAAHFNQHDAKVAASLELVERDAVLWHHHQGIPFVGTSQNFLESILTTDLQAFLEKSRVHEIAWRFHSARAWYTDVHVVICSALSKSKRQLVFGFGSSLENEKSAAQKALFECVQNIPILSGELHQEHLLLKDFFRSKSPNTTDHNYLGLDPEYVEAIKPLFPDREMPFTPPRGNKQFRVEDFSSTNLSVDENVQPKPATLHVLRAFHPNLIELYVGLPPSGAKNQLPHFIG